MRRVRFFSNSATELAELRQQLSGLFSIEHFQLSAIPQVAPDEITVVDMDLRGSDRLPLIRGWLRSKPAAAKVIFVANKSSRIEEAQACALGANGVLSRPVSAQGLLTALGLGEPDAAAATHSGASRAVDVTVHSLDSIFVCAAGDGPIEAAQLSVASAALVEHVESMGLAAWVDEVRKHHSQTYQHCLLVTGLAVGFGRHLGLAQKDLHRLSLAGMLHDIGKARIPLSILEKPGPLSDDEKEQMRQHPLLGIDILKENPDFSPEMLDVVVHHHEYLDGSGYPHGLAAERVSDLVRVMTIADVYGAMIERRSYKPPFPAAKAYDVLVEMGARLDQALVREFGVATKVLL